MNKLYIEPDIMRNDVLRHSEQLLHNPMHTHNFCEILLASAGRALHSVNNMTEVIEYRQFSFIRENDCHFYQDYYESRFGYYNLHIPIPVLDRILGSTDVDFSWVFDAKLPPKVGLAQTEFEHIRLLLDEFIKLPAGEPKTMLYDIIVRQFLYYLSSKKEEESKTMPYWFSQLLIKMQKPEIFVEGLRRVVEISGYSQEYVNRVFRRYIDMTPTAYINNLRLDYAVELIKQSGYNFTHASQCAGFNNYGYFCKLFKKRYGCIPKEMDI